MFGCAPDPPHPTGHTTSALPAREFALIANAAVDNNRYLHREGAAQLHRFKLPLQASTLQARNLDLGVIVLRSRHSAAVSHVPVHFVAAPKSNPGPSCMQTECCAGHRTDDLFAHHYTIETSKYVHM